jgi:hypothetical protein
LTTIGYNFNIQIAANDLPLPYWYLSSVTAFFFLSLAVNALLTALIVYKIMSVYNEIRGFNDSNLQMSSHQNGRPPLNPLISILIESGLMTFVGQLAQCLMFRLSSEDAFPLISGVVVMLYVRASSSYRLLIWCINLLLITQGISMVVVLVRVETGVSYDQNTLRTVNSMNLGPSETTRARGTSFALTFTKVGQTDLSNEAYSGSSNTRIDTANDLPDVV